MRLLRIFLSSPGDVAEEREVARRVLKDELPYDPLLRGRVAFEVVSWDDPSARIPMTANLTPQEATEAFGLRASQCDIVVVILWSRLGTRLDVSVFRRSDNRPYLSGTEWEFEDACNARPQPQLLVYRRTETPLLHLDDPMFQEKRAQFALVKQFFERFENSDGSIGKGWSGYETPERFREHLVNDIKQLLRHKFSGILNESTTPEKPKWRGAPYPGLRPFTTDEAPIFFGRSREISSIIARLRDPAQRFVAVVGASGTGKSSLIRAGVIPRLKSGEIKGSRYWRVLSTTPGAMGDNPFIPVAVELSDVLTNGTEKPIEIAARLMRFPGQINEYAAAVTSASPPGAALVMFLDQLEELVTLVSRDHRAAFIDLLTQATNSPHFRVLTTLRADFLPQCTAEPGLAELLQRTGGIFPLGHPGPAALASMIEGPAERAELALEPGLADQILRDAGTDPGVLPLIAFTLEELYRQTEAGRGFSVAGYRALGGLHGAIGRRTDALLGDLREKFGTHLDQMLQQIFAALIHVDDAGNATRRRVFRDEVTHTLSSIAQLIERLISGRLMIAEGGGAPGTVMLAHDALIHEWPALNEWLDRNRAEMQLLHRLRLMLTEPEPVIRQYALAALGYVGSAALVVVPELIAALGDSDESIRLTAVRSLSRIGPAARNAVPALIAAFGDAEHSIRQGAVIALKQVRSGAEAVPVLAIALGHKDKIVRLTAALALADVEGYATEAVEPLIAALADEEPVVRVCAAHALGEIGPKAAKAVTALTSALDDVDAGVRRSTANSLSRINSVPLYTMHQASALVFDANDSN